MNSKSHYSEVPQKIMSIRKHTIKISVVLLLLFINFAIGCSYYKVSTAKDITPLARHLQDGSKYFIVHKDTEAWHLSSLSIDESQKTLTGKLDTLPALRKNYLKTKKTGSTRYKPAIRNGDPTHEVHFYVSDFTSDHASVVAIPLSSIERIEIYDKDGTATAVSYVLGTIGVILGVLVVVTIIAALLKSSCPFVYVKDGDNFKYAGEMFGGAIYSSLERDDYMPLPVLDNPTDQYQINITNELLERQFINLALLVAVEHPGNSKVLLDKHGDIQTIVKADPPTKAFSDRQADYLQSVSVTDSSYYMFNDENTGDPLLSSLTFSFNKPENATDGKLVLNLKNSYWLDYVYGKFNEQFGTRFNEFSEKQKSVSQEKINQWTLDQKIPLSVYIKVGNEWQYVDYFQVVGPLAPRDVVMSIDVSKVQSHEVEIKLECGYMFWEVDYAAMDFTENISVKRKDILPATAIDEKGNDVTAAISATDDSYLFQPEVGNSTLLTYPVAPSTREHVQSYFLHSRGYYEYIRYYKNKPDVLKLMAFKAPRSFTKFSRAYFDDLFGESALFENLITTGDGE